MTDQWVIYIEEELKLLQNTSAKKLCSIYRVPKILTDIHNQAYKPKLASFGPYHHNCSDLSSMEKPKHNALLQFLRRIAESSKTIHDVVIAMRQVESSLIDSYDDLQFEKEDEFLQLMIEDGCFALEIMLADQRCYRKKKSKYESLDSIFGADRKMCFVPQFQRDMLLLENQLPLLALRTLADIDGSGIEDVNTLIMDFYELWSVLPKDLRNHRGLKGLLDQSFHILDMYKKIMTFKGEYELGSEDNFMSVTELRNAGVSFCKSNSGSFRDISFNGGILSLPSLEIADNTESVLLNLMAFERLNATTGIEVTAYAQFMDNLINTEDDVALLRTKEIIVGWVGCDKNIANMFNNIGTESTQLLYNYNIQDDVNKKLNDYCKERMHRWRASFVETYLKNPWVFTSLLGALFLLTLTVIQTLYTMLQYYDA